MKKSLRRYPTGGRVYGPGTATSDDIPAMLSDGEYVLPAKTTETLGKAQLDQLVLATNGKPPVGMASGGQISPDKHLPPEVNAEDLRLSAMPVRYSGKVISRPRPAGAIKMAEGGFPSSLTTDDLFRLRQQGVSPAGMSDTQATMERAKLGRVTPVSPTVQLPPPVSPAPASPLAAESIPSTGGQQGGFKGFVDRYLRPSAKPVPGATANGSPHRTLRMTPRSAAPSAPGFLSKGLGALGVGLGAYETASGIREGD